MSDALEFIRNESIAGEEVAEMVDGLESRVDSLCDHLTNSQKREVILRSVLRRLLRVAPAELECNNMHHLPKHRHTYDETCPVVVEYVEATASAIEALAATADMDRFVLCEKEPVAWLGHEYCVGYRHADTDVPLYRVAKEQGKFATGEINRDG